MQPTLPVGLSTVWPRPSDCLYCTPSSPPLAPPPSASASHGAPRHGAAVPAAARERAAVRPRLQASRDGIWRGSGGSSRWQEIHYAWQAPGGQRGVGWGGGQRCNCAYSAYERQLTCYCLPISQAAAQCTRAGYERGGSLLVSASRLEAAARGRARKCATAATPRVLCSTAALCIVFSAAA